MIQIDVTKSNAEMPPNLPQKLISLFKIPEIHVQTEFSTQDRALTATLRSNDCHGPIKAKLHSFAWQLASSELTTNQTVVNGDENAVVNSELTTVNWSERHFRSFLSHLPCPNGDRAMMARPGACHL